VIEARNIRRRIGGLDDISLEIAAGALTGIIGPNGAGKSTLLDVLGGLIHPTAGRITFDGVDISKASAQETTALGIVQVPGGKAVFPTLTVEEHFKAGCWLYANQDPKEVAARTQQAHEIFPRLAERWCQLAGTLSGGEQQQLAIAMAFVARPKLLIIDELSLGLAPIVVAELAEHLRFLNREPGTAVLLVEQEVTLAFEVCPRALVLEAGRIIASGTSAELARSETVRKAYFGDLIDPTRTEVSR